MVIVEGRLSPRAVSSKKEKKHKLSKQDAKDLEKQLQSNQYFGHHDEEDAKFWKGLEKKILTTPKGTELLKSLKKVGYFEWVEQPVEFVNSKGRQFKEWTQHKEVKTWY